MTSDSLLIWRTNKSRIMFWVEAPVDCSVCKKPIVNDAIHILDWGKNGLFESLIHTNCRHGWKPHPLSMVPERKTVYVCNSRPVGSVLVTPKPPSVVARNRAEMTGDWFDLSDKNCDFVTDNTVHSIGGDSFEGALIGCSSAVSSCLEKDEVKLISEKQLLEVIDNER